MISQNRTTENDSITSKMPYTRKAWVVAAIITVVVVVIDVVCMKNHLIVLAPSGDDYALIAMSAEHPVKWFTVGFSQAFNAYPEYFRPWSNFIRPTANLIFRIFSYVPDSHLSQIIAVNYLVHALLCAFVYLFSIWFKNSQEFSLFLASIVFFAPAFWNTPMVINPSFAMDGFAALMCFLCFFLIVRGRFFWGFVFLLLAILTKETALPIAAALLLSGALFRQHKIFFGSCLILFVWLCLRYLAFGEFFGGTYRTNDMSLESLPRKLGVLALLPVSYISADDIKKFILYKDSYATVLFVMGNCAIWLSTFLLICRGRYTQVTMSHAFKAGIVPDRRIYSIITLVCVGASIAFFVLAGGGARFSYVTFIFWVMFISTIEGQRTLKYCFIFFLLPLMAYGYYARLPHVINVEDIRSYKYKGASEYVDFLKTDYISDGTYVFGDYFSLYSSQDSVAKYVGLNVKMSRGSSVDISDCSIENIKEIDTRVEEKKSNIKHLVTTIPSCAAFTFPGADKELLAQSVRGDILLRNDSITYRFVDIQVSPNENSNFQRIVSFGQSMEVTIVDSPILYFDFKYNKWIYLPI